MGDKRTRKDLTKAEILNAAQSLAQRDGMEFPMRDLADALSTWPNAIYGHFKNKFTLQQALVDHILDEAFTGDIFRELLNEQSMWEDRLRRGGQVIFEVCKSYYGLGRLLSAHGMGSTSKAMQLIPALVMLLMRQGMAERRAATFVQVAIIYITTMGDMAAMFERGITNRDAYTETLNLTAGGPMADTMEVFFAHEKSERVMEGIDMFIAAAKAEL
ncbi:MAG: TetR/AcrR family transcriptional regulator [Pseudomonadota bacterium]